MLLQGKIGINLFLLVLLCVIEYHVVQSKDAKCEGSVIFHWRIQKNDERNNKKHKSTTCEQSRFGRLVSFYYPFHVMRTALRKLQAETK